MKRLMPSDMYPDTKTWNPAVGCDFDCVYCRPSFQRQLKRVARTLKCQACYDYTPHYHPERLNRIPSSPIVFVCGTGDLACFDYKYVWRIFRAIDNHKPKMEKTYYFQSKNPFCFERYLPWFDEHEHDVILLTTLETNSDEGYKEISQAPLPTKRFWDFYNLKYPRKVVTIEPVLDNDPEIMATRMILLKKQGSLEYVWFGFDSKNCGLPEPSIDKAQQLVNLLQENEIEVRGKTLRGVNLKGEKVNQ